MACPTMEDVIQAILFDLGNVLVPFDFKRGYVEFERLSGRPASEIPKRIGSTDLVRRFESGQIEPGAFVRDLCDLLDLPIGYDEFCKIFTGIFLPATLVREDLLERLARRYRLVLLSNTNAIHYEMIEASYSIVGHFHERVLSYKVGAMKPSPAIYEAAVARAGCRPEECFFTDDVAAYVDGARQAGIDAVQFQSCEQIESELRARGVEW